APGARFARLLGTGRGAATTRSVDLRRWAALVAWDDADALDQFLASSPLALRWGRHAEEAYHLRLTPVRSDGRWGRRNPFAVTPRATDGGGPVVVLPRATIRPRAWGAFGAAQPGVDATLGAAAPGLLRVAGVGELPVGLQGTVSLWRDADAVTTWLRTS